MRVRIQSEEFDVGAELARVSDGNPDVGAVVSFTGIVRNDPKCELEAMTIEHYPGMTEKAISGMAENATDRWDLIDCSIIHRFGTLKPGDIIMMVVTASRHRANAFQAAEFLMDFLKSKAPFWKKEFSKSGSAWVESREEDEEALDRWVKYPGAANPTNFRSE